MRLQIDENMSSRRLAAHLRAAGHDVVTADEAGADPGRRGSLKRKVIPLRRALEGEVYDHHRFLLMDAGQRATDRASPRDGSSRPANRRTGGRHVSIIWKEVFGKAHGGDGRGHVRR